MSQLVDPMWSTLRILGQSKMVSMTIFVPVIGYMILLNEDVVGYLSLSDELLSKSSVTESNWLSFSDTFGRLRLIYLGLVFVGIASFIFKIRCPSEILRHRNEYDYIHAELAVMTSERFSAAKERLTQWPASIPNDLRLRVNSVEDTELSETLMQVSAIARTGQPPKLIWDDWYNRNRRIMSEALSVLYDIVNQSRVYWRSTIFALYVLGFLILLWPSLEIFIRIAIITFT